MHTAETGCGIPTVLFSQVSSEHFVFTIDDRGEPASTVDYFVNNDLTRMEVVRFVFGPSQQTLPAFCFRSTFDCVLLDGPHAYPFQKSSITISIRTFGPEDFS